MKQDLIQGKWYVFDINPAKAGVQGIGSTPGKNYLDYPVSDGFDTEEQAEVWLTEHPEHQTYGEIIKKM